MSEKLDENENVQQPLAEEVIDPRWARYRNRKSFQDYTENSNDRGRKAYRSVGSRQKALLTRHRKPVSLAPITGLKED